MSIDTDPILNPVATPQLPPAICYPLDKCPKYLYLCLTGIKKGDLWGPGDPEPPNGIWRIEILKTEWWAWSYGPIQFQYLPTIGRSDVKVDIDPWTVIFIHETLDDCRKWFVNNLVNPAIEKYYDGFCLVTEAIPEGGLGEEEIMSLMNLERRAEVFARPTAMADNKAVHAYFDARDKTNVKILYDYT